MEPFAMHWGWCPPKQMSGNRINSHCTNTNDFLWRTVTNQVALVMPRPLFPCLEAMISKIPIK
jgi:hypothetical protein